MRLEKVRKSGLHGNRRPKCGQGRGSRDDEQLLRGCIAQGIAQGERRAVDPAMASRLLLAGLNQMVRWHRPGGRLAVREVIDQYLDITMLGLVNRAAAQPAAR